MEMLNKKCERATEAEETITDSEMTSFQFLSLFIENTQKAATKETKKFLTEMAEAIYHKMENVVSVQGVSDDFPCVYHIQNIEDENYITVKTWLRSVETELQEEMVFTVGDLELCGNVDVEEAFYANVEDAIFQRIMRTICRKIEEFAKKRNYIHEIQRCDTDKTLKILKKICDSCQAKKGIIIAKGAMAIDILEAIKDNMHAKKRTNAIGIIDADSNYVYTKPDLFGENRFIKICEMERGCDSLFVMGEEKNIYEPGCIFAPHHLYIEDGNLYLKYDVVVLEGVAIYIKPEESDTPK